MENVKISELMSIQDYAKYYNVTRQTVYKWIREKKIKPILISGKKFLKPV